ncbi:alpha-glucosidase/alpha-galactosidase [Paenibacillus filicis]|uniref:Alpha-glucosidase/alpha-galactosidase n=1 Tax=Paenibacillus gyeongsangnamensis TaxID=3388067 RepID=A0ABT4QGS0_9BACL|nr:alpha-glucosidase/alpha-galactosidase [Paenibacillus filicis]MCZ8516087.1 alpha-glucosidase/alpha-galactosidase [Paenibacillus filicis]
MEYSGNQVKDINIAYIGGGSKGWAWALMGDLAMESDLSGTVKLYDLNYEAAHVNSMIGNSLNRRDDVKGKWQYQSVETLEKALTGADFVIISILPGTFKEMTSDVNLPQEYGIYQSVGDTTGPGGIVRALRTIPMYVEMAEAIKAYCPDAWVINYTNPMTLCTRTLTEIFPEIKVMGCCHEIFGAQKLLASMLKDLKGIEDVGYRDITVNVLGINHFTWIDEASYQGTDLMPIYREFVDRYYESGYEEKPGQWMNSFFSSACRVQFDLFRRYGLLAASGDRHLAEFMPRAWYLKDPETVKSWKFSLTPIDFRMKRQEELAHKSKRLAAGQESVQLKPSGEEGICMMKALLGLGDFVTNVNVPNQGQIKGLPLGSVVETNALLVRDGVKPVLAGQLPLDIENLVARHVLNQETVLKAALRKDKSLAFRAFLNDPLVSIDIGAAEQLFERMLQNTKAYLPGWDV